MILSDYRLSFLQFHSYIYKVRIKPLQIYLLYKTACYVYFNFESVFIRICLMTYILFSACLNWYGCGTLNERECELKESGGKNYHNELSVREKRSLSTRNRIRFIYFNNNSVNSSGISLVSIFLYNTMLNRVVQESIRIQQISFDFVLHANERSSGTIRKSCSSSMMVQQTDLFDKQKCCRRIRVNIKN